MQYLIPSLWAACIVINLFTDVYAAFLSLVIFLYSIGWLGRVTF